MIRTRVKILSLLALLLFPLALKANVSTRNGNFFIGYTDLFHPGGFEPKVDRVYNSKTPFKGIFGWGWGSEHEPYLTVSADSSVVVHEYGGGAENRFSPVSKGKNKFKADIQAGIERVVKVAKETGRVANAAQLKKYKDRLKNDASFRNEEWEKYIKMGRAKPIKLKKGTQLQSNRFSYQYITKMEDGYLRSFDNGRVEKYNNKGKLVKVSDKNGNFVKLSYGKDGKLLSFIDNLNRRTRLEYNNRGLVIKAKGDGGKVAIYKYNALDELIYSKDSGGNEYWYKYSKDRRHNLTEIKYGDKTTLKISYYPRNKNENVKSVKDRDGTLTEYSYQTKGKEKLVVGIKVKDKKGKTISNSSYDYTFRRKPSGEEWTYRMVSTVDGFKTETTYNECCGLPILIKRGSQETAFDYDIKGRVVQKITPTLITKLAYHPKVGKVTKVEKFSKKNRKLIKWSKFKYDKKGNLVFAKNSDKKGVKLFYDLIGRISSMVDQDKRRIDFKYNENSKPVEISDPKLGSIKVKYSNGGEIKKVESSKGRKIALQVTSAFQNLLDIIRPAGVTLSFER